MEKKNKYVYIIKDPLMNKVVWVGESVDTKRRLYQLKYDGKVPKHSEIEIVAEFENRKDAISLEAELKHKYGLPHTEGLRAGHWNKPKPIIVHKKDTDEFVGEYYCVQDAVRRLDLTKCCVYHALAGRTTHHRGYTFQYK